jgi:hypothetical protein
MLPASRSPIRGDSTAKQFSLRLKTDYENVAEKVRLVEFRFFASLVEI